MPCKPFSIVLAVLAPDNKRQISFAMSRGCIDDNTPIYVINFVLRDKVGDEFQDRVRLHVTVGDTDNAKAEKLITNGLTMTQLEFLQGPVTAKAKRLAAGTTTDKKTEDLIKTVVNA
jgi:hypothetical protein